MIQEIQPCGNARPNLAVASNWYPCYSRSPAMSYVTFGLCLRPSRRLAAENLFLRKQLALYQERTSEHGAQRMRPESLWCGSGVGLSGDRP